MSTYVASLWGGTRKPVTRAYLRQRQKQMQRLRAKGWSYRRIAAKFGISHARVEQVVKRAFKPKRNGPRSKQKQREHDRAVAAWAKVKARKG